MQLEVINKLFLELSQVATAKTAREIALEKFEKGYFRRGKILEDIFNNCPIGGDIPNTIFARISKELS